MPDLVCCRSIIVSGRVQGVGFRYATQREATRLELLGWVRNTHDGKVEIVAEGPVEAVDTLQQWCHRGPAGARVTSVVATDVAPREPLQPFTITR